MIPVAFVLSLVVCFALFLLVRTSVKPKDYPPGPIWFPIVGSLFQIKEMSKRYKGRLYDQLRQKYNTNVVGLKMGETRLVVVSSYALIKKVLLDDNYSGRPPTFFLKLRSMGKIRGITSNEGKHWAIERSFVVRHLRNVGFGKITMESKILQQVDEVIRVIDRDPIVSFDNLLPPSVLNVLWSLAAGIQVTRDDSRIIKLLNLLRRRTLAFDMSGSLLSHFPWFRHVMPEWTGYNLIKSINCELRNIFMETINDHEVKWTENQRGDLIYAFITEVKNASVNKNVFNYDELLVICLDLFIAGSVTTSETLNFAFFAMLLNPNIQDKAQKVLDSAFKLDHPVVYADRHQVPYIEAIIMEVQRYYTVLPVIGPRRVFEETYLDGYRLTNDITIILDMDSIYKDSQIFVEPEIFRPERFLNSDGELNVPVEHLPFGLGKRKCLGDALAKSFIFTFFVEILRRYNIRCPPGEKLPENKPIGGITRSAPKYLVNLIKRY